MKSVVGDLRGKSGAFGDGDYHLLKVQNTYGTPAVGGSQFGLGGIS